MRLRVALDPLTKRQLRAEEAPGWIAPLGLILALFLLVSWTLKLYRVPREIRPWKVLAWAADNTMVICALNVLATFFSYQFGGGASRVFVLCMVPVTFVVFAATRFAALAMISVAQRRSPLPRIALIGDLSDVKRLMARMEEKVQSAIRGLILPEGTDANIRHGQIKILGTTAQIAELVNRERLDSVIVVNGSCPEAELERCNKVFWRMGMPVSFALDLATEPDAPSLSRAPRNRIELSRLNGFQVVDLRTAYVTRTQDAVKRVFDFAVSLVLLALAGPAMLLIGIIVKLNSEGPVLEKAPRVGKGGRHFTCLKFRTTYEDLNKPAPLRKWNVAAGDDEDEHHATGVGKVLRHYSLDELPQFINILRGEMSLVGPRPLPAHRLGPDGMSTEFADWSEQRARVCPGLTGLWQVGGRSRLSFNEMIELDLQYIRTRSFALDLGIILKTPIAVIRGLGAC
jgi:lipopolysaccharide/colanic/teichoic acid biosynthesis glycosyltransferase